LFSDLLSKADWIMAAPRRVVELAFAREDVAELTRLARSRTEPVSRAERARMLLAYRETPSFYAVGRALGVTHQTVERCLRRAEKLGIMEALDDSPRPGRERIITEEARTFVVDLACRKPKLIFHSCGRAARGKSLILFGWRGDFRESVVPRLRCFYLTLKT
jgi:hypothetical protein